MNRLPLEGKVLRENDRIALALREQYTTYGVLCLNLVSSPDRARHRSWSGRWNAGLLESV